MKKETKNKNIYIVFSATNLTMGKFIRIFTKYKYNHVSLSIDDNLKDFYSFARHNKNNPLYGGFVKESNLRYKNTFISIYKLEINPKDYYELKKYLNNLYKNKETYIYNMYSAISYLFKKKIKIANASTCIDFIIHILSNYKKELNIDSNKFYLMKDLEHILNKNNIYQGIFNLKETDAWNEDTFPEKKNIVRRIKEVIKNNLKLNIMLLKKIKG